MGKTIKTMKVEPLEWVTAEACCIYMFIDPLLRIQVYQELDERNAGETFGPEDFFGEHGSSASRAGPIRTNNN